MATTQEESSTSNACNVCGKEGKRCSRCQGVFYCSRDCQKNDWSKHKKVCFLPGSVCTRCLEVIDPTKNPTCRVPHPAQLVRAPQQIMGFGPGMGGMTGGGFSMFSCQACGRDFQKKLDMSSPGAPGTFNPPRSEWCFQGCHTTKALAANDMRKITEGLVSLIASPSTQAELDALTGKKAEAVRILTIKSSNGMVDPSCSFKLKVKLINLEELRMEDVHCTELELTPETTPNLKKLHLDALPDICDGNIQCEKLEDVHFRFMETRAVGYWVAFLCHCSKDTLVKFQSYKIGMEKLLCHCPKLRTIDIEKSHYLQRVELDTPSLDRLKLENCTKVGGSPAVREFRILNEEQPSSSKKFLVNTEGTHLTPEVVEILQRNPRAQWNGKFLTAEEKQKMTEFFKKREAKTPDECKQM